MFFRVAQLPKLNTSLSILSCTTRRSFYLQRFVVSVTCSTSLCRCSKFLSTYNSNVNLVSVIAERGKTTSKNKMASSSMFSPQNFDYFLVLDFEATCDNQQQLVPQEIIEFPVLKVSAKTFNVESEFHYYVKPQVHTELTPFCTKLTGIIQEMVHNQPSLEEVLEKFHSWMEEEGLLNPDVRSVFVTCGDWDLKKMLPSQCKYLKIPVPSYMKSWVNIKKSFAQVMQTYPREMMGMLSLLEVKHVGHHHSGIDDSRNIAAILRELALRGKVFFPTGHI